MTAVFVGPRLTDEQAEELARLRRLADGLVTQYNAGGHITRTEVKALLVAAEVLA